MVEGEGVDGGGGVDGGVGVVEGGGVDRGVGGCGDGCVGEGWGRGEVPGRQGVGRLEERHVCLVALSLLKTLQRKRNNFDSN